MSAKRYISTLITAELLERAKKCAEVENEIIQNIIIRLLSEWVEKVETISSFNESIKNNEEKMPITERPGNGLA